MEVKGNKIDIISKPGTRDKKFFNFLISKAYNIPRICLTVLWSLICKVEKGKRSIQSIGGLRKRQAKIKEETENLHITSLV